jgi:hypothetical protein
MNSLSWLIYFIGMVESIGYFALWLAIPGTLGLCAVLIIWMVLNGCQIGSTPMNERDAKQYEIAWHWWSVGKNIALVVWLIGWMMIIFIPSRQSLILIAGSEIGQQMVQSKAVQDVVNPGMDLLKTWITTETTKLKESVSPKKSEK